MTVIESGFAFLFICLAVGCVLVGVGLKRLQDPDKNRGWWIFICLGVGFGTAAVLWAEKPISTLLEGGVK